MSTLGRNMIDSVKKGDGPLAAVARENLKLTIPFMTY